MCSILTMNNKVIYNRMVKKQNKFIRYSEFQVHMRYNLQPLHNEPMLCVQWNSIYFKQTLQGILVSCFTESFRKGKITSSQ